MGCNKSKTKTEETNANEETEFVKQDVEPILGHYKYPSPPRKGKRKKDIFNEEQLQEAEQRASSVPYSALKTYDDLLKHLITGTKNELEIAWTIYIWLTRLDMNNPSLPDTITDTTPRGFIKQMIDNDDAVATLYTLLCRRSKVQCVTIEGIAKKDDYEIGTSEGDILQSRDKWNAIYVKESWHLVHPRLGRKAKTKSGKAYFFLVDPEELITWCLPDLKEWQLLRTTLNLSTFNNIPYCQPKFFQMGLKVIQPKFAKSKTNKGKTTVEIVGSDCNVFQDFVFQYGFRCVRNIHPKANTRGRLGTASEKDIEIQIPCSTAITVLSLPQSNAPHSFSSVGQNEVLRSGASNRSQNVETADTDVQNTQECTAEERNANDEKQQQRTWSDIKEGDDFADGNVINRGTTLNSPYNLQKYVLISRSDSKVSFEITCPFPGVYVLNIESRTLSEESLHSEMSLVCCFKFLSYESAQPGE